MISPALNEKFYREYMTFFEQAERTRRWNPFTDVDWDALSAAPRDDALALSAETFCGVEMYLPDYIDGHLDLFRDNWARAWFAAAWGYEESKHALTLWRYLVKGGYRTDAQMHELAGRLLAKKWRPPFTTGRTMTVYGAVQEMTTAMVNKMLHGPISQLRKNSVNEDEDGTLYVAALRKLFNLEKP